MICLAYASVPLYSIFCKATGYGGTIRKVTNTTTNITNQKIRVHFNADIMSDLPWEFKSETNYVDVNIGEQSLAFYYAKIYLISLHLVWRCIMLRLSKQVSISIKLHAFVLKSKCCYQNKKQLCPYLSI